MHKRALAGIAFLAVAAAAAVAAPRTAHAQGGGVLADSGLTATNGITRVLLYRVADGATMGAITQDRNLHLIPLWEAQKKAGLIVSYSSMFNATRTSEDDWQFGYTITYANWAALDGLGARGNEISLKHYGTAAARTAANQARNQSRVLISNRLVFTATFDSSR